MCPQPSHPPTSLSDFLDSLLPTYGTAQAVADAVGVTLSPFSRGIRQGSLGTMTLLRLALKTHTSPSLLLRLSRKEKLADLLERLYGKPRGDALSDEEEQHLARLRALPRLERQRVYDFLLFQSGDGLDRAKPLARRAAARG